MIYYSLNNPSEQANFKEATIKGQAPDKGLYFPQQIPNLPKDLIPHIDQYSREEIAFRVIQPYIGDSLPETELHRIVAETIRFDFPLVKITDRISSLELFHGPTLAFKDVGARFMSRCLGYFVRGNNQSVTVLVATSGDTGGAVASGFHGVEGVNVVILYPSGKVSSVQELQLTTLGKNISALEVNGSFDDCQRMVKQAFMDKELNREIFLTSANSINVARWLPQQFYYFFAYQQWIAQEQSSIQDQPFVQGRSSAQDRAPVISVPSGNFGNICAGLLAHRSGLPVQHFIAACNANNVVPDYLQTGQYTPKTAISTLSNAMDVGDPSNFVRILELFHKEFHSLKKVLTSVSISDEETKITIKDLYNNQHYLADPHGAVGYLALSRYLAEHPDEKGFFLETAHPVKFYDTVEPVINQVIHQPDSVLALLGRQKQSTKIEATYDQLKDFLLSAK